MGETRHELGHLAESIAARWLDDRGWRVLETRLRTPHGELDLVALDPCGELVGVEVKARRTSRAGLGEESVDARRVRRLRRSLATYAASGPPHVGVRIDLITLGPGADDPARTWRLRHLRGVDAW